MPLVGASSAQVGWYQINCICCDEFTDTDNATWKQSVYKADVQQLIDAGFHGVKLDDCGDGSGAGLLERVKAINASGWAMLIENSNQGVGGPGAPVHNGRDNPTSADAPCPFNLFRTGGDIVPDFDVVIDKLQRTVPYLGNASFSPISRPGCWACGRRGTRTVVHYTRYKCYARFTRYARYARYTRYARDIWMTSGYCRTRTSSAT